MGQTLASHDSDIREALFEYLDEIYPINRIIEELTIDRARADVVMVRPDSIYGIEIKSDNDTYTRLANQVKVYNRFFDYNIVAVGSTHAAHISEHVPEWWGIITIEEIAGTLDFYYLRKPQPNPKVKANKKLSLLWRPELARIQERNKLPKYKDKSKDFVRKKLIEKLPEEVLWSCYYEELMDRDYTTIRQEIEEYRGR
ncbi:MAG: sce7726 family protein [Lachnospiraceae bacterium]|nr:sce7726 family protein [Lachnospiraceae bacterium]